MARLSTRPPAIEWPEHALQHLSRIVLFDDLEKMESYDPGCRPRLTQWIA